MCSSDLTPPGAFVEVGVYRGGTAWHLAQLAEQQKRTIFLYDTFTGIPYRTEGLDSHHVGDFGDTSYERVCADIPYATVVKGVFPQSARAMQYIAFVHLDVDQYQSYKDAIKHLRPLMAPGGVIWFDDVGCLPGATQAVEEEFGTWLTDRKKPYVRV